MSNTIIPMLKRDFLRALPTELAIQVLMNIDNPRDLTTVLRVSRRWRAVGGVDTLWKVLADRWGFDDHHHQISERDGGGESEEGDDDSEQPLEEMEEYAALPMDAALEWVLKKKRQDARRGAVSPPSSSLSSGTTNTLDPPLLSTILPPQYSYRRRFAEKYIILSNWHLGAHLLRTHHMPIIPPDTGVVTSLALDSDWIVIGLTDNKIHIFSTRTGVLARTLVGHTSGVWGVCLIQKGGRWAGGVVETEQVDDDDDETGDDAGDHRHIGGDDNAEIGTAASTPTPPSPFAASPRTSRKSGWNDGVGLTRALRIAVGLDTPLSSNPIHHHLHCRRGTHHDEENEATSLPPPPTPHSSTYATPGWGQQASLVVSGGSDKSIRVWDLKSGHCIYTMVGHTATVRCLKMVPNRPLAVSGSRDATLRVWDVRRGRCVRVLEGHEDSVRCLDLDVGRGGRARVVSGSCDLTCRVWDVETGDCLFVLRGHLHQVYSVAFKGDIIASGGLDTTIRIWDAETGMCTALLQNHTSLVCQLHLTQDLLATGGSDGRVITFALPSLEVVHRFVAHESSLTGLMFGGGTALGGGKEEEYTSFIAASDSRAAPVKSTVSSPSKFTFKGKAQDESGRSQYPVEVQDASPCGSHFPTTNPSSPSCSSSSASSSSTPSGSATMVSTKIITTMPTTTMTTTTTHDDKLVNVPYHFDMPISPPEDGSEHFDGQNASRSSLPGVGGGGSGENAHGRNKSKGGAVSPLSGSSSSLPSELESSDKSTTPRFIVTCGNDGRARLFSTTTGESVRELSERSRVVWKVGVWEEGYVVVCKREKEVVVEVWSLKMGRRRLKR